MCLQGIEEQETKVFTSTRHQNGKAYLSWIQPRGRVIESDHFSASVHAVEFESELDSNMGPGPGGGLLLGDG